MELGMIVDVEAVMIGVNLKGRLTILDLGLRNKTN